MITRNRYNLSEDTAYQALSSDTKPTENVPNNSLLLELDTGDFYYFINGGWAKIGSPAPTPPADWEVLVPEETLTPEEVTSDYSLATIELENRPLYPLSQLKIVFNGTEYICDKQEDGAYGAEYDDLNDTYDFSEYPFNIVDSDTLFAVYTASEEEYTIEIFSKEVELGILIPETEFTPEGGDFGSIYNFVGVEPFNYACIKAEYDGATLYSIGYYDAGSEEYHYAFSTIDGEETIFRINVSSDNVYYEDSSPATAHTIKVIKLTDEVIPDVG